MILLIEDEGASWGLLVNIVTVLNILIVCQKINCDNKFAAMFSGSSHIVET